MYSHGKAHACTHKLMHLAGYSASRTMSVVLKSNENYNFEKHIKTPNSFELCPTC